MRLEIYFYQENYYLVGQEGGRSNAASLLKGF